MYSLQFRLRSVVFCLHSTSSRSYKKIQKIDHFNEFGKVLSKDVFKLKKKTYNNRYKTQLDHLKEFGPVLTADALKKDRKIIKSKAPAPTEIRKNVEEKERCFTNEESSEISKPMLDHFDEFGPALTGYQIKKCPTTTSDETENHIVEESYFGSEVSKPQLDHFDEFGPVLAANELKKRIKTMQDDPPKRITVEESYLSDTHSQKPDETKMGKLFNSARLSAPLSGESPSVLRVPHQYDEALPSVTRILSATMSEESKAVLARWEKEKIAVLGPEGFKKYKAEMFSRGKYLHSMLETFLDTRTLPRVTDIEDEVSKRHRVSISQMIGNVDRPRVIESSVCHSQLGYSGIVDCVAVINNTLTLIDWKTSEKVKNNVKALYDNPLQLAAYIGAINQDERYASLGNITSGAVVVIYNSGYPAMTHTFSERQLENYWKLWCQRLSQYKLMTS